METKTQIRKRILKRRDEMPNEERYRLSEKICLSLFSKDIYRKAKKILLFASYRSEVDTWEIFRQARCDAKKVYFPLCKDQEMHFYEIRCESDLSEGYKGILEPKPIFDGYYLSDETIIANTKAFYEERLFTDFEDDTVLMIMPGAAFDLEGNRIGYGGGFYDRFLSQGFQGKKLALSFDCQILTDEIIPSEQFDIKPDVILSESKYMTFSIE